MSCYDVNIVILDFPAAARWKAQQQANRPVKT